ncbi:MAG: DUF1016 family protein [Paludibacteraceae bacterium]|nr:DUF1016 family protein [Paludibacteraceae bacterium]
MANIEKNRQSNSAQIAIIAEPLLRQLRELIDNTRKRVASVVSDETTQLYWNVGNAINTFVLQGSRAEYGKQIVVSVSRQLAEEYGSGFEEKNVRRMVQFATEYQDFGIVASLIRQLSWTHFIALIPIREPLKRSFYEQMAITEHWSVRMLREKISSQLYERTAISRKPEDTIKHDIALLRDENKMTPDMVFRDPYLLHLFGLKDTYSEKDLESAIVAEMQRFIEELGSDFAFLARQKRITIDNEDYYIDLLFYHRRLHCLVAIDLKIDSFKAAYKGQMELYLRWLEKYERVEGENAPIGLILCAGKNDEHVELMHLEESNIRVAEYMTMLPDKKILEQKLQKAIAYARERMAIQEQNKSTSKPNR